MNREYDFSYANFVNLIFLHKEELSKVSVCKDLTNLFNKREISKLKQNNILVLKEVMVTKAVLSQNASQILKNKTWLEPIDLNRGFSPSSDPSPLRVCKGCGFEAWEEEDLDKFMIRENCLHGRGLYCKNCNNERQQERKRIHEKVLLGGDNV